MGNIEYTSKDVEAVIDRTKKMWIATESLLCETQVEVMELARFCESPRCQNYISIDVVARLEESRRHLESHMNVLASTMDALMHVHNKLVEEETPIGALVL